MTTGRTLLDPVLWGIALGFMTACILVLVSTDDIYKISLAFLLMIIGLQAGYTMEVVKNKRLREELRQQRIREAEA